MRARYIHLPFFIALCISLFARFADGGEAEVSRFLSEYPAAGKRLADRYSEVSGLCKTQLKHRPSKAPEGEDISFNVSDGSRKATISHTLSKDHEYNQDSLIFCVNPKGTFKLSRSKKTESYSIIGFGPFDKSRDLFWFHVGRYLEAPFKVEATAPYEHLRLQSFTLTSVNPLSFQGHNCLDVKYRYATEDAPKVFHNVSLVIDPDAGWVIRHWQFFPGGVPGASTVFDIQYGPSLDGVPTIQEVNAVNYDGSDSTHKFSKIVFEKTSESEFTLDYYGLPDITL